MPRATVDKSTETEQLTTCEGAFVELRRMSFGEKLAKDAEAMKMRFDANPNSNGTSNINAEVAMVNEKVAYLEFARCVVDHNLEDSEGRKLNLANAKDVASLDPRIGEEIQTLIGEMNDFERQAQKSKVDAETGK